MPALEIISHSEEETTALGRSLAKSFRAGDVIVLTGQLGSGKTAFVKGLAQGFGIDSDKVSSPTYTIVNEYQSDIPVFHFDLYRMNSVSDLKEIGWEDYLQQGGITVVEWGEKAEMRLPSAYYAISFEILGDTTRRIVASRVSNDE